MPIPIGQALESDFYNPLGVLSDCHRRIARFLEAMITVVEQARSGPLREDQREALGAALKFFREAAPKHTSDEEDSLFPRVRARAGESGKRFALLTVLHGDHVAIVKHHDAVEKLGQAWLRDSQLPHDELERLHELLSRLRETYQEHIEIEETKLFPFAARVLSLDDLREIGTEMAHRRGLVHV